MQNPLLEEYQTPFGTVPFDQIKEEHYLPALNKAVESAKQEVKAIIENTEEATFSNTIEALEYSGEGVGKIAEVFFNLNSAETNDQIQKIAQEFSPILSAYKNDIMLDKGLFDRVKHVWENRSSYDLKADQKTLLDNTYQSFVRNGALLDEAQKETLRGLDQELSKLSLTFGEHVLAETNKYELVIDNEADLEGLPGFAVEAAAALAKEKDKEGKWVITLDYPSYVPFMTYSSNRTLREELYRAFGSKAFKSDDLDNQEIVRKIVQLRHKRAELLGYDSHANFVLERRMAESPSKVNEFLNYILKKALPAGKRDVDAVAELAKKDGIEDLQRWDFGYYAEKLKKEKFNIDDEVLKPYFSLDRVVEGAFETATKLYGIYFEERADIAVYHSDVKTYEVKDKDGNHVAVFYTDFHPRAGKRGGAWMTSYRGMWQKDEKVYRPHVSIVCNFTKPTPTKPSLLTFNEVTTLFHEFGHALHGILAEGTYSSLTGTNVYWDFVELPSQVLENWCYEKECLDMFAKHYETNELIPMELVEKIKASATFNEGYQTVRQLSFGMLDMNWHSGTVDDSVSIADFENKSMSETELFPPVEGTNMSVAFSHIFQGGYSAGYYSYKWAEVLDADAFEFFKEKGIFDKDVAEAFKENVLSAGGSEHPMELYKRFRGKEPNPDALLRRAGLIE